AEQQYTQFFTMKMGAILIGLGFLCFLIPAAAFAAALGIIVLTIGEIYYMPFASAWVASRASDANRGQYMALYTIAWATASVIAPSAGFLMIEQLGFNGLWLILSTIGFLGALGFWLLGKQVENGTKITNISS
ncbi:MAG: MFS transporter, partial [Saprospiraceae bacterium]